MNKEWISMARRMVVDQFGDAAAPDMVNSDKAFPVIMFDASGHGLAWLPDATVEGLFAAVVPGPDGKPAFCYTLIDEKDDGSAYGITFDLSLAFEHRVGPPKWYTVVNASHVSPEPIALPRVMATTPWRWHHTIGDTLTAFDGAIMASGFFSGDEREQTLFFATTENGLPVEIVCDETAEDGHGPVMACRFSEPDGDFKTHAAFACAHKPTRLYDVYHAKWDARAFSGEDMADELARHAARVAFYLSGGNAKSPDSQDEYAQCVGVYATDDLVSWHRYL